jgi:hypothetical protein
MIEPGKHFGFTLEARELVDVRCHGLRENLDGDGPLQVRVGGPIDLTHTTHAELGTNLVRAESGARDQRHSQESMLRDYSRVTPI